MDNMEKPANMGRRESLMRGMDIFGMGNPILDIVAHVDVKFIESHNLPKNSTLLAGPQHEGLFDDIANAYDIEYLPGCSVQNALRYCEWVVGKNKTVATYIGAVGDDHFGNILATKVKLDGLNTHYMKVEGATTGVCAILFYNDDKNKTIVTNLGASKKIDKTFLNHNFVLCERAKVILVSGHSIPVTSDSVMWLAEHAHEWGKDFMFNIGATYVIQKNTDLLLELFPYIDFFFCNAEEAMAFALMKGYTTKDLKQVAKMLADEPRKKYNNPRLDNVFKTIRIVIITQKEKPVLMAKTKVPVVKEYPVPPVDKDLIKDSSSTSDAFIGGFLAMYIDGRDLDFSIQCGIYCSNECLKQVGSSLPKDMTFQK